MSDAMKTDEEKARGIMTEARICAEQSTDLGSDQVYKAYWHDDGLLCRLIAKALKRQYDKGRNDEAKEWEDGNRTMRMVWNEAIEACEKIAIKQGESYPQTTLGQKACRGTAWAIADLIAKLKKPEGA